MAVCLAILAGGCVASRNLSAHVKPAMPATAPAAAASPPATPLPRGVFPASSATPIMGDLPTPTVIDLGMYEFWLPYGAVSQNKQFWKWVREPVVDLTTHDLLYQNGLRVGEGEVADWSHFKKIFDAAGARVIQGHFMAPQATNQQIVCTGELPQQTLFFFDRHGLSGRVYDGCQNLFYLTFGPAPRQPQAIRIELCPVVRATERRYEYTVLNNEQHVDYVGDEHLYDLGLHVDLPVGKFLIVAPSVQSDRSMSIGHQFLTQDAAAGRREMVLIFVANPDPHVQRLTAVPTAPLSRP
jgi:hypothetical protein